MERVLDQSRRRITARVSHNVRRTLELAAELLGVTVNQFVVQTAYPEAQRIIERESVIRLSQRDARRVLSLLDRPPKPAKKLKEAVKALRGAQGDQFDATFDADEDTIILRRVKRKTKWLAVWRKCPVPLDDLPPRSRELPKKITL